MRVQKSVHFEILGQRGGSWTILGIQHAEGDAIKEAKAQRIQGGYRAVKVMREKYHQESRTFRTREVFFEGKRDKPSKLAGSPGVVACWRPQDFYSYEGRRTISRLLRSELASWQITATELVHSPEYVERLEDCGTAMQRAVQQIAIAEAQATDRDVQRLNRLIAADRLPNSQRTLVHRLTQEVTSTRPLSDGSLLDEARSTSAVRERLERDDGTLIGDVEMVEALQQRTARNLTSEAIGEYLLRAADQGEKIHRLVVLEPHVFGVANKRKLANHLLPILESAETEFFFIEQNGTAPERIKALNRLQYLALRSGFQDTYRRKFAEKFDEYCSKVLKNTSFFQRLGQGNDDRVGTGISLLRMCADGYFTEGRAVRWARAQTMKILRTHGFLDAYLAATDDASSRAGRLRDFQTLLAAAGFADDMAREIAR